MKLCLAVLAVASMGAASAIAQDLNSDKGKLSYAEGYDIGRSLAASRIDVDPATLERGIQDGMTNRNPVLPPRQMGQILRATKERVYAQVKAEFDKAAAENQVSSDSLLAKNRSRPGVRALPSGIQYRVIEEGSGPSPAADGQVRILYRMSIATGQEIASSYNSPNPQPTTVVISESPLAGIKQILPMMHQGAHWEILLPPDQAYGSGPGSPVGPNQAVMFDIKVVEVMK